MGLDLVTANEKLATFSDAMNGAKLIPGRPAKLKHTILSFNEESDNTKLENSQLIGVVSDISACADPIDIPFTIVHFRYILLNAVPGGLGVEVDGYLTAYLSNGSYVVAQSVTPGGRTFVHDAPTAPAKLPKMAEGDIIDIICEVQHDQKVNFYFARNDQPAGKIRGVEVKSENPVLRAIGSFSSSCTDATLAILDHRVLPPPMCACLSYQVCDSLV
eukprot:Protomagalhaensia_wolfi_Nauph_80__2224@NODE_2444_length_1090_cov_828_649857_g1915_i0_p1_GENE_NODE_2444_length_1090_cov_828_649857_g1915_i0NODE_2444_length_1090_cov_828_649857_g1915_i0_p1_ORF_typecomplete_len217_score14_69_NODE_2444_length_1090_cov_828_649857_g1915_i0221871